MVTGGGAKNMIRVQIKMADVSTNVIPLQDKSFADATKDLNCIRTGEIACREPPSAKECESGYLKTHRVKTKSSKIKFSPNLRKSFSATRFATTSPAKSLNRSYAAASGRRKERRERRREKELCPCISTLN